MNPAANRWQAISKRVKQARTEVGYSQADMGKRLGLSETGYGHYERGRQPFTIEQLLQISRIFSKPLGWFLDLPSTLSDDEEEALELYRQVRTAGLADVALRTLKALAPRD